MHMPLRLTGNSSDHAGSIQRTRSRFVILLRLIRFRPSCNDSQPFVVCRASVPSCNHVHHVIYADWDNNIYIYHEVGQ